MPATVTLEYFAWVRERIGKDRETITLTDADQTVQALLDRLQAKGNGYADAFAERDSLRFAINENYVPETFALTGGDRLAIFPPVTGG
jgi:sulfur-carrier protein